MRLCDLKEDEIVIGLIVRSLKDPNKLGVIVDIDYEDDRYTLIKWAGEKKPHSGFYFNDCKCEVVGNVYDAEEQAIIAKRDVERRERGKLIVKLGIAEQLGNFAEMKQIMQQICAIGDIHRCEHDRSTSGTCAGCDELIEKLGFCLYDDE